MPSAQPDARGERSLVWVSWCALAVTLLAALGLRLVELDHTPGINGDEPQYAVVARELLRGEPIALRTGTQLPMNPVFFGVDVLLQSFLPASLLTLRIAPLVCSWLALILAGWLFRARGAQFVVLFVSLLAVLPAHLVYARFSWDASAIPLVMVLALAAATSLRPVLTGLAFALSLWVHPTTVFALPIWLAPFVAAKWPRSANGQLRNPNVQVLAALAVALALAGAGVWALIAFAALPAPVMQALRPELLNAMAARALSVQGAGHFLLRYAELISGPTVYRYIAGSMPAASAWSHVAGFAVMIAGCILATRRTPSAEREIDRALIASLPLSLLAAYLLGGPSILEPSTERYGMFLTVPSCYVMATCADALATSVRAKAITRLGFAALSVLLLASFTTYFMNALHRPDAARENTFRTGEVDPKQLALQHVLRMRAAGQTAVILAQDWWIYWTIRYLAERERDVLVTIFGQRWDSRFPNDFVLPRFDPKRMQLFVVSWAGTPGEQALAAQSLRVVDVGGYEPAAILRVHQLLPARR